MRSHSSANARDSFDLGDWVIVGPGMVAERGPKSTIVEAGTLGGLHSFYLWSETLCPG